MVGQPASIGKGSRFWGDPSITDESIIKKRRKYTVITETYDPFFFAKKHGITLEVATCILSFQRRTRLQPRKTARKFKAGWWSRPS